jgi:hypothetical protein
MVASREEVVSLREIFPENYRAFWLRSTDEGWAGFELCINKDQIDVCVCRVIFWDAVGQYFVELPNGELKAEYIIILLIEAAKKVKTRLDIGDVEQLTSIFTRPKRS